ncbi:DUF7331 family protein [Halocatena pleomorpha]|uniref:Uncharacterized protein n=1 Tax=Halocatena pleomorpha TaxID=1785090 RepID=A0A3P3RFH4_9EURY|nr:hypothetical protein [Halocatena pleomorpha]RRJ32182.1 hypothetical protein EIK79_05290 [Halocatena pleomorpha]
MGERPDTIDDSFRVDADSSLPVPDLDEYASYEDGDRYVICDRSNANAWIRSDSPTTLSR